MEEQAKKQKVAKKVLRLEVQQSRIPLLQTSAGAWKEMGEKEWQVCRSPPNWGRNSKMSQP